MKPLCTMLKAFGHWTFILTRLITGITVIARRPHEQHGNVYRLWHDYSVTHAHVTCRWSRHRQLKGPWSVWPSPHVPKHHDLGLIICSCTSPWASFSMLPMFRVIFLALVSQNLQNVWLLLMLITCYDWSFVLLRSRSVPISRGRVPREQLSNAGTRKPLAVRNLEQLFRTPISFRPLLTSLISTILFCRTCLIGTRRKRRKLSLSASVPLGWTMISSRPSRSGVGLREGRANLVLVVHIETYNQARNSRDHIREACQIRNHFRLK